MRPGVGQRAGETARGRRRGGACAGCAHLEVLRDGDAVVARTQLRPGRSGSCWPVTWTPSRSPATCPPGWRASGDDAVLYGRGTADMKSGLAVHLRIAATVPEPNRDVTFVFYDNEEVDAARNGLGRLVRNHPDWLAGQFAVLGEPTSGLVEGGCNGTLRVEVTVRGVAAHSARSWLGRNAVHEAGVVLDRLAGVPAPGRRGGRPALPRGAQRGRDPRRRGRQRDPGRVRGHGQLPVRPRPDGRRGGRPPALGVQRLRGHRRGRRRRGPPRPGPPGAAAFIAAIGRAPAPKQGWTDVARFSELGVPAVNYGPGDPLLAHRDDEHVQGRDDPGVRARAAGLAQPELPARDERGSPGPWPDHAVWWQLHPISFLGAPPDAGAAGRGGAAGTGWPAGAVAGLPGRAGLQRAGARTDLQPASRTATTPSTTSAIDPRLGDDEDFDALVARLPPARRPACCSTGCSTTSGAGSARFRDVLRARAATRRTRRGSTSTSAPTPRGRTASTTRDFEGHQAPGRARTTTSPPSPTYVADVMSHWLERGADGWRLDAAYAVPAAVLADGARPGPRASTRTPGSSAR